MTPGTPYLSKLSVFPTYWTDRFLPQDLCMAVVLPEAGFLHITAASSLAFTHIFIEIPHFTKRVFSSTLPTLFVPYQASPVLETFI